jgi:hypothetical protein
VRPDEIDIVLKRRPFKPFRMTLVTSQGFDVNHPEQLILSEHFAAYGVRESRGVGKEAFFVYWIDLAHVVHICGLQGFEI